MSKKKPRQYKIADFDIVQLDRSHISIINKFRSYEKDLVDFLTDDALDNQEKDISITYLWLLKGTGQLAAYITLLTDTINLSPKLKEQFRSKNIRYKSLPALKIGRLCVDDGYLRRGIGRLLISFAISHVIKIICYKSCY